MDNSNSDGLIAVKNVIREIAKNEIRNSSFPTYIAAVVQNINDDGTINVFIPPNQSNTVTNLLNKTGERLETGDSVEIATKNGSLTNCWIAIKHGTTYPSVTITDLQEQVKELQQSTSELKRRLDKDIFLEIYPVGSIYVSLGMEDPEDLFGGSWEPIKGRFLLSTGTPDDNTKDAFGTDLRLPNLSGKYNVTLGSTGGASVHTLTTNQIPSHGHRNIIDATDKTSWSGRVKITTAYSALHDAAYKYRAAGTNYRLFSCNTENTGGGGVHNNVPPYLAVNMWQRTA